MIPGVNGPESLVESGRIRVRDDRQRRVAQLVCYLQSATEKKGPDPHTKIPRCYEKVFQLANFVRVEANGEVPHNLAFRYRDFRGEKWCEAGFG